MKTAFRFLLPLVIGGLPLHLAAQDSNAFFFVQLADTQFGYFTSDRDFAQETAAFEFVATSLNRLKPAFVVVCGDLVNKPGDAAQIAEYQRIAGRISPSIPLYNVAGNHDVGNEPTPESLAAYRERFGRDYYSFRHGDLMGIVLNSGLIHTPTKVQEDAAKQQTWLKAELAKARSDGVRHLLVFQHHPFFLKDPLEPDQYFNIPLERRTNYLAWFKAAGVSHIFAGHYHQNSLGKDGELEMVTSGPVGKPGGTDSSGIRVVTVRTNGIEHRYYTLGQIPNQVSVAPPRQSSGARRGTGNIQ